MSERLNIAITGASGLVGTSLDRSLSVEGHEAVHLVRIAGRRNTIPWDPAHGLNQPSAVEGFDAIVHLAGENIAAGRWTSAQKEKIRASRVDGTRTLCRSLASLDSPPRTFICASAIGYYGDRGNERLTEDSRPGTGFLPETCVEWEAASAPLRERGVRVVNLRFGVILSGEGGALAKMLIPFKLGAGGKVGSGSQYMSWVSIDDAVGIIGHALTDESLKGPVNSVSPEPVTNAEFTKVLARVLSRPAIFPMPAFAARLAFGEMADSLLLASARVYPERLQAAGYPFRHPGLEAALRHVLGRP